METQLLQLPENLKCHSSLQNPLVKAQFFFCLLYCHPLWRIFPMLMDFFFDTVMLVSSRHLFFSTLQLFREGYKL